MAVQTRAGQWVKDGERGPEDVAAECVKQLAAVSIRVSKKAPSLIGRGL
jgi:hypothetical protein